MCQYYYNHWIISVKIYVYCTVQKHFFQLVYMHHSTLDVLSE